MKNDIDLKSKVIKHYKHNWGVKPNEIKFDRGPMLKIKDDFLVLEFPPSTKRSMWTYATCGMSTLDDTNPIELHIFSKEKDDKLVELLTAIAFFHLTESKLNLWHTINFGQSWKTGSKCTHGLISLPYLDGPTLENIQFNDKVIKSYWLIPITPNEVTLKKREGVEALEALFEKCAFNYLDPHRESVF